jgi:hypothetical protein
MTTNTTLGRLLAARANHNPFGRTQRASVDEYLAARAALDEEARDDRNWNNPAYHRQIAALVAQQLDYGFAFDSLFPTYFLTRTVGEWDQIELRERRGLKVFYTSRGGYIEESQLTTQRWTLPRDTIGFHVSEHEDKLRANFGETIEAMVGLAQMRMDAEINRRMFNLLQAAIPSTSPYYVNASTGLTKANLDSAVTAVMDAVKPSNGVIPPVTIIGRRPMIDQISAVVTDPAALYDPGATAEIRQAGRLGVYRGANIVQVRNYTDENDESYLPANELWVFGGTVGQFVFYGDSRAKAWSEEEVDYNHYRARRDIGGLINHSEQARRIIDGTVSP